MIDHFKRYQKGLKLKDLFPLRNDGYCACGCGKVLTSRQRRWASVFCQDNAVTTFFIVKGDTCVIRSELYSKDEGYCRYCGVHCENWEADHIRPVYLGGAACDLSNLQTLCSKCHKVKSYTESHLNTISSQAASILAIRRVTDFDATSCVYPKQSNDMHNLGSTTSSPSITAELQY